MKLSQCVDCLTTKTLMKILDHHPPYTLDQEPGMDLSFLLDPNYLGQLMKQMSDSEKKVLTYFLFDVRNGMLSYSQINSKAIGMRTGEFMYALTLLRQKGLIFTHRRFYGEMAFFMPEDVRSSFIQAICLNTDYSVSPIEYPENKPSNFFENLWILLKFIWSNQVQITQKGTIHRRILLRLLERMQLFDEDFDCWALRFEGEEVYPKSFAVHLDFAIYYELIGEKGDSYAIKEETLKKWLELSENERIFHLLSYLKEKVVPALPKEIGFFLDWLECLKVGKWTKLQSFHDFLANLGIGGSIHFESSFMNELKPFERLGLIRMKEVGGEVYLGRPYFKEDHHSRAYVQPNLQVMVPAGMPIAKRWRFHQIADLVSNDQMLIFELTKQSIERALEKGMDRNEIHLILESNCYQVPENVLQILDSWMQSYGQVRFLDVVLLECRNAELVDEILKQEAFKPYLLGRIGAQHLIIHRNHLEELRERLEAGGYSPMKKIHIPDQKMDEFIYSSSAILNGSLSVIPRVENVYPELEDALPELKTIPKAWLNQYRSYHIATLIDLIKKSIEFELRLTFEYKGETYDKVKPNAIQELGGQLMVKIEDAWIPVQEIGPIQVYLPIVK